MQGFYSGEVCVLEDIGGSKQWPLSREGEHVGSSAICRAVQGGSAQAASSQVWEAESRAPQE